MSDRWEGGNEDILGYCAYCKEIIREGENHVCIDGEYYHFDLKDRMKNCYFPEGENNE